jgi:hypothetical protein
MVKSVASFSISNSKTAKKNELTETLNLVESCHVQSKIWVHSRQN